MVERRPARPRERPRIPSLGFYPAISPPRSVYDELSGSAGLSEVSSPRVRTAIAGYDPASGLRLKMNYDFGSLARNPVYMSGVVNLLRNHIQFQNFRKQLLVAAESMRAELDDATSEL